MLAGRDHSRQELARKLGLADPEAMNPLLDELQVRGWLSEQRLVDQLLLAAAGRFGVRKVMHKLTERGVSQELVAQARRRALDNEVESARAVWRKRFGKVPANLRERAQQTRFLEQRGFEPDAIREVLRSDFAE